MTFFERYEKLCLANGYKPGSTQAAEVLGTSRGTISAWKTSGKVPTSEYLISIANAYHVSVDYLLGRTDDSTDYADPNLDGDAKKALALQKASAKNQSAEATPLGIALYGQLDSIDKGKAEAFMQGLLAQDKYTVPATGKKHA